MGFTFKGLGYRASLLCVYIDEIMGGSISTVTLVRILIFNK